MDNPTKVNGIPVKDECALSNGDVFTIIDRSFRYESAVPREFIEAVWMFLIFIILYNFLVQH